MGSPRTLNEVLTSSGQPVRALKALDQAVKARIGLAVHGLQPCRIVDVGDGRHLERGTLSLSMPNRPLLGVGHWQRRDSATGATISM
jgi:hypothetical protein